MSLRKFNLKTSAFKQVLDLTCIKKRRLKVLGNVSFFKWFSNFSNLILSNGSENLRNVIQMAFNWDFFEKLQKSPYGRGFCFHDPMSSGGWELRPRSTDSVALDMNRFGHNVVKLRHFLNKKFNFKFKPFPQQNPICAPGGSVPIVVWSGLIA